MSEQSADFVSAALIIIGNEILSGRTQDKNLAFIAAALNRNGIQLREVRVIPDIEDTIIATVNEMRAKFDYVFTSGGIGPTHDDITAESIAKAFGLSLYLHPEANALLEEHYGENYTPERAKMAKVPEGAALIANPVSRAPGFNIGNVYVLAGVPRILQAMIDGLLPGLKGGKPMLSRSVTTNLREGDMAQTLGALQEKYPDVDLGSYPFFQAGQLGTSIVARSMDEALLQQAVTDIKAMMESMGGTAEEDQDANGNRSEI